MTGTSAQEVLDFWFQGDATVWRADPWFVRSAAFDAAIAERFGLAVEAAQDGVLDGWAETAAGTVALLLVLDQFARNIHRGSHRAFAGDAHARGIARAALAGEIEGALGPVERVFLYLPFEHSEELADQDLSVTLFDSLPAAPWRDSVVDYAERHRAVIREFGRFPHRNAVLGRESTPAELAWLAAGGGF